jgi:hypothetical protein
MPMVAQQLQELPTHDILIILALTAKNLWSIFHSSGSLDNGCATVGISWLSHKEVLSQREMPTYGLEAES